MQKYKLPDSLKHLQRSNIETKDKDFIGVFIDTLAIVNPKNILETGVNWGISSIALLTISNANLTSFDPIINVNDDDNFKQGIPYPDKSEQEEFLKQIKLSFGDRWTFHKDKSENAYSIIGNNHYDLFHIDGDHWYSGLDADYDLALKMNIEWLLVDDFNDIVAKKFMVKLSQHYMPIRTYSRDNIPIVLFKRIGQVNIPNFI